MEIIIAIIALILVGKPIVIGILRLIFVLFSGIFNLFGKIILSLLAILGIATLFFAPPIGFIVGLIIFIIFKAAKS